MARKTASRLQLRKEAEAATAKESASAKKKTTKKKTTKKKTAADGTKKKTKRAKKVKAPERKRLIWGVFAGNLKEEARFPYDQRAAAEEKIEQLRARSTKKMYFIQPIKEAITDAPVVDDDE